MIREQIASIGTEPTVIHLTYVTPLKLGKAGRPEGWKELEMTKHQTIRARVNFLDCSEVADRLEKLGLPTPEERFLVPAWGEQVGELPIVKHSKTGEEYLWVVGEGVVESHIMAGDEEITGDPRLLRLMGRPSNKEFPEGTMSFCLKLSNIQQIEQP